MSDKPRFDQTTQEIAGTSLLVKFKELNVKAPVNMSLSTRAILTYVLPNGTSEEKVEKVIGHLRVQDIKTTGIVESNILATPKGDAKKKLANIKYTETILKDDTNKLEHKFSNLERKILPFNKIHRMAGAPDSKSALELIPTPPAPIATAVATQLSQQQQQQQQPRVDENDEEESAIMSEDGVLTINLYGWQPPKAIILNFKK